MKILITGSAGFIGFFTVKHFLKAGYQVVGLDNINDYYDINLKYDRLRETGIKVEELTWNTICKSTVYPNYSFYLADLIDKVFIDRLFEEEHFDLVCNLAAQAGVRFSISHPYSYINSNVIGFLNILEACRYFPVKHLVYASSSSVYGLSEKVPNSEIDQVDSPISLYAATKKSNELMAYCYSKLYNVPSTGLRFFTVYGPWGRPDMAPYHFMDSIINKKPINVFNKGRLARDFTYIDDIIEGLSVVLNHPPIDKVPFKIYNIGRGKPVQLLDLIATIENVTGKTALKNLIEMQPGDVYQTYADTNALERDMHYQPQTTIHEGIFKLYEWYITYVLSGVTARKDNTESKLLTPNYLEPIR